MNKSTPGFHCNTYQYTCQKELNKTHSDFCSFVGKENPTLKESYINSLSKKTPLSPNSLIDLSLYLEEFLKKLFSLNTSYKEEKIIFTISWVKKFFIQKRVKHQAKKLKLKLSAERTILSTLKQFLPNDLNEKDFCFYVQEWLKDPKKNSLSLEAATFFSVWALTTDQGKIFTKDWVVFDLPEPVDFNNLVSLNTTSYTYREGFNLTDKGPSTLYALDQANYCLYCHDRKKDSCATGKYIANSSSLEKNPLGYELGGCPLEQKISEMNLLASNGHFLSALAIAMIDNPLLAATGHRICQDCSKSCIFQKQTPVDIPSVESFLLETVLNYPYGFEIYNLLTKWNPLNIERPLPKPFTNKKVLIVGTGPAGFNLAYHLLMEGHFVLAIDGLKLETLPINPETPIFNIKDYFEPLSQRIPKGFGGVAEYGITVRWNKNYLLPIRLILERWKERFKLQGSTLFGSTITLQQAFDEGFDHVALCVGAGKPHLPNIPNALCGGAKLASDFLMSLQLTGLPRKDSLLPLTLDLPCVVVGGGLTAIDTATEALAYYPLQIEKIYHQYKKLKTSLDIKSLNTFLEQKLSPHQRKQLNRWLDHAKELEKERILATKENRKANLLRLLNKWGGVQIIYRKKLQESPAYILNHPELKKALEEGIVFLENLQVNKINTDKDQNLESLLLKNDKDQDISYPAKSLIWATGIQSRSLEERRSHLKLPKNIKICWPKNPQEFLLHKNKKGQSLGCFGDYHPFYTGSVVKAMASAKKGYKIVSKTLASSTNNPEKSIPDFKATVYENKKIAPGVHQLIFHAPRLIKNFQPGNLYRVQPYFHTSSCISKGVALTGIKIEKNRNLLHTIVWSLGNSSKSITLLKNGDPVSLMGPTGCNTYFQEKEKILLVAGYLGVSLGKKMRASGCQVVYTTSFRDTCHPLDKEDFFHAGDWILASYLNNPPSFLKDSPHAFLAKGQTLDALNFYMSLKNPPIKIKDFDRIIVIGSTKLLINFYESFYKPHKHLFQSSAKWITAVTTPMQCMMKGLCGQCLQKDTFGNYTFSCATQDQDLSKIDFNFMEKRLQQNKVQELLFKIP